MRTTPVQTTAALRDGSRVRREQRDFEGAPGRPLMWQRTVEKFHSLSEQYAEERRRDAIVSAVAHLDEKQVSELTVLLAHISTQPQLPKTGPRLSHLCDMAAAALRTEVARRLDRA
jgi:2-methylcitrate dehydratase